MRSQKITLGQSVEVSINHQKEETKFMVIENNNGLINLAAHEIGNNNIIYSVTIKMLPLTFYRIYTRKNLADTTSDADEIVIKELGYNINLDNAKLFANDYIKSNFFHKNTNLREIKGGTYSANDPCIYRETIIIEPITISY